MPARTSLICAVRDSIAAASGAYCVNSSLAWIDQRLQSSAALFIHDGIRGLHGIIKCHRRSEFIVHTEADIINITDECIGLASDLCHREHAGRTHRTSLDLLIITQRINEGTVDIQFDDVLLVLEFQFYPFIDRQCVVERVIVQLSGESDLACVALNGLDASIRALKQDLIIRAVRSTLYLDTQVIAQSGSLQTGRV